MTACVPIHIEAIAVAHHNPDNYREKCIVNFVVLRGLCDPALLMMDDSSPTSIMFLTDFHQWEEGKGNLSFRCYLSS